MKIPLVKNLGKLSNKKVLQLQASAKYTIASEENIYSIFIIECISNHVKVILNERQSNKIKFFKKNFIKVNFNTMNNLKKLS